MAGTYKLQSAKTRRGAYGIVLVVLVVLAVATTGVWYVAQYLRQSGPDPAGQTTNGHKTRSYDNALQRQAVEQLRDFDDWLSANDAKGYIGEFGWPATQDGAEWAGVAQAWLEELGGTDMWATAWAAGSRWQAGYALGIYTAADGSAAINQSAPQAAMLEDFWRSDGHKGIYGVNVAGMEFGSNVSAANRGTAGTDYFYEPADSFAYLASRGVKLVRLPMRWERVQPKLFGPLDGAEMTAIRAMLDAAAANDIKVVLDLHNYGTYANGTAQLQLGSADLTADTLGNAWGEITRSLGSHPAVAGYSLMNEPHDLPPQSNPKEAAKKWESITQQVVNSLRGNGFDRTIMVPGYDWSSLARWSDNHPKGWIRDPLGNFRYEAHHYWDGDGSGKYAQSFADELVSQD